jgi:hypothetical protein
MVLKISILLKRPSSETEDKLIAVTSCKIKKKATSKSRWHKVSIPTPKGKNGGIETND